MEKLNQLRRAHASEALIDRHIYDNAAQFGNLKHIPHIALQYKTIERLAQHKTINIPWRAIWIQVTDNPVLYRSHREMLLRDGRGLPFQELVIGLNAEEPFGTKFWFTMSAAHYSPPTDVTMTCRWEKNPLQTRFELRVKVSRDAEMSALLFAYIVLLCDGYLQRKMAERSKVARFVEIMMRLPMDVQMLICNRVQESPKNHISVENTELALRYVASCTKIERAQAR